MTDKDFTVSALWYYDGSVDAHELYRQSFRDKREALKCAHTLTEGQWPMGECAVQVTVKDEEAPIFFKECDLVADRSKAFRPTTPRNNWDIPLATGCLVLVDNSAFRCTGVVVKSSEAQTTVRIVNWDRAFATSQVHFIATNKEWMSEMWRKIMSEPSPIE